MLPFSRWNFEAYLGMFISIITLLSWTACRAQEQHPQLLYNISCESDQAWCDTLFSLSTSSETTKTIFRNKPLHDNIKPLFSLLEYSYYIQKKDRQSNSERDPYVQRCNVRPQSERAIRVFRTYRNLQIGFLDTSCETSIDFTNSTGKKGRSGSIPPVRRWQNIMEVGKRALFEAAKTSMPLPTDGNWSERGPFPYEPLVIQRDTLSCAAFGMIGLRLNGTWYTSAMLTNKPAKMAVKRGERHRVFEWIPDMPFESGESGRDVSALIVPKYSYSDPETLVSSSTYLRIGGGVALQVGGGAGNFDNKESVGHRVFTETVQKSNDVVSALSARSISLHCFPLVFTLLPIVLFVPSVRLPVALVYMLVTDVAAAIPSMVLGARIIRLSYAEAHDANSAHLGNDEFHQIGFTSVSCTSNEGSNITGIIIIAVAALGFVLGNGLDALVFKARSRQTRHWDFRRFKGDRGKFDEHLAAQSARKYSDEG